MTNRISISRREFNELAEAIKDEVRERVALAELDAIDEANPFLYLQGRDTEGQENARRSYQVRLAIAERELKEQRHDR